MRKVRRWFTLVATMAIIAAGIAGPALAIEHATTPENDETRNSLIASGTLLRISLVQTVSSAHCKVGDKFAFHVIDDVKAGARVAIPAGTSGSGKITVCAPAHGGRQNGKLSIEFDPIALADGTDVVAGITHDSLVADANAKNGTAPALEDIANMTIPGFFLLDFLRKGDDITLAANSPFHIAVTQDAFLSE